MASMSNTDTAVRSEQNGPERHDVPRDGRSGFVRLEDRQVHYLEWGQPGTPLVLALHGGGQTSYMYEEIGSTLRDRCHVLAPDLPSHGDSDHLDETLEFSRELLASTLPPLIEEFGGGPVAIIGASLGGILALTLAADRPELVSAIVLIDVGHRLEEAGVRRIIDFLTKHESFGSLEEAADAISEYTPNRPRSNPARLSRNLRRREDGRWVWKHNLSKITADQTENVDWDDIVHGLGDDAAKVRVPVLVLRGAGSDVLSRDGAAAVASVLHDARLVEISGAGHLAAGDNPTSTVEAISAFLDEVLPAAQREVR
jgi:pimeloyl-ACP methyl ester carboxylesterase